MYADCPGEFDTKGLTQSICNARVKSCLANKAQQVKVTLVAEQDTVTACKGTAWSAMVRQLDGCMNMNALLKQKALSMVVTQVGELDDEDEGDDEDEDNPLKEVRNQLNFIKPVENQVKQTRDYFTKEDNNALAIFCKPKKKRKEYIPYHLNYDATAIKKVLYSKNYVAQEVINFTIRIPPEKARNF
eukprot:TRINITY_DN538_c0_g2_i1.p1 TRINITY_DN538_c0_g2~~TRINITY_DN538_c0_g2_i1.p1  ORF type:complete len:187 (+),score=37.54 TRINITY_DN538_c0_g2_i1:250-810(+)